MDGASETQLLLDFLNTHRFAGEPDPLLNTEAAARWLTARNVTGPVAASDLTALTRAREALRRVLLAHAGHDDVTEAAAALRNVCVGRHLAVEVSPRAGVLTAPAAASAPGTIIERLLVLAAQATSDGTWTSYRACGNQDCQAAFLDITRNHTASFCSKRCSTLMHVRAHRERRRTSRPE